MTAVQKKNLDCWVDLQYEKVIWKKQRLLRKGERRENEQYRASESKVTQLLAEFSALLLCTVNAGWPVRMPPISSCTICF